MITRFAVHPSYQSKGLGKLLVLEILKEMKNMGYHTCSLRVFSNRPEVLGWYGRLGFKETGERRKFNPLPGKKVLLDVDFIIMKKEL
jgi:ribosomal protein S18 acetylase RimI-like enzyme